MDAEITGQPDEATVRAQIVYWATLLYIAYCDGDVDIAASGAEPMEQLEAWLTEYERIAGVNVAYLPAWLERHLRTVP